MDCVPVSDLINIESFYHNWASRQQNCLRKFEHITADYELDFSQLEKDCSDESLQEEHELTSTDEMLSMIPSRIDCPPLQTLKYLENLKKNPDKVLTGVRNGEYKMAAKLNERVFKPTVDLQNENCCIKSEHDSEQSGIDDVMLTVLIFRPNVYPATDLYQKKPDNYFLVSRAYVFKRLEVLGSQFLTDLKDCIRCPQDYLWLGDCSESLDDNDKHVLAKDIYPSSYFFIENTFYNDMRHPVAKDLSSTVISWIRSSVQRSTEFGEVKSINMESVRFRDLQLRVGKCYLYLHQGNCEHFIVFSDIRLSNRLDCRDSSLFPILTGKGKPSRVFCKVCRRNHCFWLVKGTDLIPESPCPLCDHCLRLLLYTKDGKKKGDFSVFMFHVDDNDS